MSNLKADKLPLNLAPMYDPEWHIPFGLIGFTTIILSITVFLVAVGMWNMNPGQDSIIYKMTSQRKKDQ